MVVLLRAFTHLDAYEDSLERAGLRPYVVGGRGYWSQQQVADACALLATIANPLDDQALFGALASPACGLAPDTLWLLRAAAGRRRHVWPAIESAVAGGEAELAAPERLGQIPDAELALLTRFVEVHSRPARARRPRLPLAGLLDAAVTETGYDLAVLMRPAGEARFANVRKLMRLAEEFESREGRDLRGLLDFLAVRAESEAEAQAATAGEGHDGVRIMTVHNAKGLEFGVVAVPDLSRSLLAGTRAPLLNLGREPEPGSGCSCAGWVPARSTSTPTRSSAREPSSAMPRRACASSTSPPHARAAADPQRRGQARAERRDEAGDAGDRADGRGARDRPRGRLVDRGLAAGAAAAVSMPPSRRSQIDVRVNLPSPERAAELARAQPGDRAERLLGPARAPLVERRPPTVPRRPALLLGDRRLRGVRLPLLHGARPRPRHAARFRP